MSHDAAIASQVEHRAEAGPVATDARLTVAASSPQPGSEAPDPRRETAERSHSPASAAGLPASSTKHRTKPLLWGAGTILLVAIAGFTGWSLWNTSHSKALVNQALDRFEPLARAATAYRDARGTDGKPAAAALLDMHAASKALSASPATDTMRDSAAKELIVGLNDHSSLMDSQMRVAESAFKLAGAAERAGAEEKYEKAATAFSAALKELDGECVAFLKYYADAQRYIGRSPTTPSN
ncbi:MAG: hypothetical protein IAG10_24195 [Planctomycetaceae bacterium]|nr:hypothetical protein [Planctomycetaceae bacterium]